ncbi:Mu transposase C-terminal domain-containing protein [Paenibacillus sp. LHD-38]|uniref:Mu transposase C-terminal domain-containing protein n=1 Tax=Paenibacillus sp. LHD-38 TaxID=3072143 RepID=UPI00280D12A2|nr:Mu transposase C-terminal domain-containing protein [Paenibacillus sp. LHD-38]MDQ8734246.1 Mu transposase C-terminal domain-containing protein [Paenibacillus sp. LHD-38]
MITIGSLIEWIDEGYMERVLWIDSHSNNCFVIRLNAIGEEQVHFPELRQVIPITSAIAENLAIIRTVDPYIRLKLPDPIEDTDSYESRDKAWELIKDLIQDEPDIYDCKLRWAIISERVNLKIATGKTYYKYLRRYWAWGMTPDALFPADFRKGGRGKPKKDNGIKRGRPSRLSRTLGISTGVNLTEEILSTFKTAIKLFYHNRERKSLSRAFDDMIEKWFNIGYETDVDGNSFPILPPKEELPTFSSFKSWYYKNYNTRERNIARQGKRSYNLRHRAVLGTSEQMAFGPGSIFQIDATIADVYLVNRFDRTQIIGRPVIYMIVDAFSRLITGMYVGLEGPSWTGARMALANAFESKVDFCKQYKITITEDQWPSHHLPKGLLADNGELKSKASDNVVGGLRIPILTTAPYRADWKGIVEQQFNLLNVNAIKWLPGAINKRHRERGEPDHRLDGKLDLFEFTQIIIHTVMEHNLEKYMDYYTMNEFMIGEQVQPYPLDLWNWGIQNRNGSLRTFSSDFVRYNLMPKDEAVVTENGIRFEGMTYSCSTAIREAWFETARATGYWKVPISYDFRNMDAIYLSAENGQGFERCDLNDRSTRYKGKRLEEVMDLHELEKLNKDKSGTRSQQAKAMYKARRAEVVENAIQKTNGQLSVSEKSDHARVKGIRDNRRLAKEENREKEKFDIGKKALPINPANVIEMPLKEVDLNEEAQRPHLTKKQSFLKLLGDLDDE